MDVKREFLQHMSNNSSAHLILHNLQVPTESFHMMILVFLLLKWFFTDHHYQGPRVCCCAKERHQLAAPSQEGGGREEEQSPVQGLGQDLAMVSPQHGLPSSAPCAAVAAVSGTPELPVAQLDSQEGKRDTESKVCNALPFTICGTYGITYAISRYFDIP